MAKYETTPPDIEHMPPGILYIVGNEMAERFSFYGMRTILVIFMTKYLLDMTGQSAAMEEATAKAWYHDFVSAVYFFPILGAIASDWLFGKYPTIIGLSLVYCAGHFVLALMDVPQWVGLEPRTLLIIGLALISIGSGGIKPCVSAHVGDQFGAGNQHLLSKVYGWFYFSINFGSTFSTMLTPKLLEHFGPGWAFGVPGVLMVIATFAFWMGRNKFVHVPPAGRAFWSETFSRGGRSAIANLIPLYVFVAMFWALFDQTGSSWVLQANQMERTIWTLASPVSAESPPFLVWLCTFIFHEIIEGDVITRFELLPSQLQVVNPFMVMILIPIFSYGIYPLMGRFFEVTPLRKVGIGLFLTAFAALVPTWVQMQIDAGGTPHMNWQVLAYFFITAAEVMVSITALEFSYTQAPQKMKSFIMGLFMLSVTLGNIFVARVNQFISSIQEKGATYLDGANYFWFFAGCMLATSVAFLIWSQFYKGETFIQGDDRAIHAEAEAEGISEG